MPILKIVYNMQNQPVVDNLLTNLPLSMPYTRCFLSSNQFSYYVLEGLSRTVLSDRNFLVMEMLCIYTVQDSSTGSIRLLSTQTCVASATEEVNFSLHSILIKLTLYLNTCGSWLLCWTSGLQCYIAFLWLLVSEARPSTLSIMLMMLIPKFFLRF